jgi:hypothetical protein
MKRLFFVLMLILILLPACRSAPANTTPERAIPSEGAPAAADTPAPAIRTDTAQAPTDAAPSSKLPAAPFEAQTYINEEVGFALDYPAGWMVKELTIGPRGTQVQFLSSPELAETATLPEGATRLSATIYQWDPKNDLAAFVANQKGAWEASGFTILAEEPRQLELGLPAVQFTLQTPDIQAVFLIAAIGEQYLVLSGEGDLELVKEIVGRVRPISR